MARELLVRAVLDTAEYARGTAKTVGLNRELDSSFKTLSVNATKGAEASVAAAVKQDQALRARITSLRSVAAAAPAGSREQIAATNLANAAQQRLARSMGVTAEESARLGDVSRIVGSSYKSLAADAKTSAQAQIASATEATAALRAQLTALRETAAAAPAGSSEQVAATNLANEAQLKLARSYGVTAGEAQQLLRVTRELGVASQQSAQQQIRAAVAEHEALRANIAALRSAAAAAPRGSREQIAAVALANEAQNKLARSYAVTSVEAAKFSQASRVAEKDIGKATRGLLSGATAGLGFGRSLAFASAGFLAFAGASRLIRSSITGAEDLEKAQRALTVAIQKTGGNVARLGPQYAATAKRAQEFGIDQADALTGLARATVLTGDAGKAQRAYQEALVISKATGKDFNSVLTATAKGQEGVTTSLRRYGILIDKGASGQKQFQQVFARFAGQAQANTTESDRFGATLQNTEAIIGTALLPTVNRYLTELGAWLDKMNQSGRLQRDVNGVLHAASEIFHALGSAIAAVDKVTGGFGNTLKLAFEIFAGGKILKALVGLDRLAAGWLGVTSAANAAAAAEERATALGAGAGLAGVAGVGAGAETGAAGLLGGLAARRAAQQAATSAALRSRISQFTPSLGEATTAEEGVAAIGGAAVASIGKLTLLRTALTGLGALAIAPIAIPIVLNIENRLKNPVTKGLDSLFGQGQTSAILKDLTVPTSAKDFLGVNLFNDVFRFKSPAEKAAAAVAEFVQSEIIARLKKQTFGPGAAFQPAGRLGQAVVNPAGTSSPATGQPFGAARPIPVFKNFQETVDEQLAQAQAALTKGTSDDVAAAKALVARIKRLIDQGHLAGNSLLQALQAEAGALSTIWSAEDAAAQKRAAAAQAAKARIVTQIQNAIDPLPLEVALSRAEAFGQPILPRLRALLRAAEDGLRKAIAAHNLDLEKQALDQITSLKQQIQAAKTTPTSTFQLSPRLSLALARDQALGIDPTKDLLKAKAAILKFIRTHQKNIAALTDAYNQLAQINQQLGSSVQSALGAFKQASTRALTAGLGLTEDQRKKLRARLSQLGPGGTVPGSGVGAAGFIIDPRTGQPVQPRRPRVTGTEPSRGDNRSRQPGKPPVLNANIDLDVYIDGKRVEATVTRRQQKRRRRNPGQRRGPNAGIATT